jgi:hypothetical protein
VRKPNVLRDNRDLRLLFVAQNLSFMGDWFTFVALAGLVQDVTDSAFLVSLLLVAFRCRRFLLHRSAARSPIVTTAAKC